MSHFVRIFNRLILSVSILVVTGCASQPSKYKRKKGCDCPKWNMHDLPDQRGIRANFGPTTFQYREHC